MNFLNKYALILLVFLTSSCSSLDSLRFWQSDEIDPDEPKVLSSFSNQKTITIAWKKSFKGENKMGNFQPDFSSQNLFFSDITGNVVSINSETGIENWSSKLNFLASGTAAGFGIVIVSDIEGNVIALNQNDGSQLWTSNVKGEVLTKAAIDAKIVVVKTGSGGLIGLEKETGNIQWSYRSKLPLLTVRGNSSPVIVEDRIYASFDNGRLAVFEIDSGFPVWDGAISYVSGVSELENLIDSDSSPVIAQQLIFATNYQGRLTAFDLAQKRPVWNAEASSFHSPVIGNNMLMVIQDDGSILSFSMTNLSPSWSSEEYLRRELSNGSMQNNLMLVGDLEGYIHVINTLTGITVGRRKVSGNPIVRIVSFRNLAYVIDQESNIVAVSF